MGGALSPTANRNPRTRTRPRVDRTPKPERTGSSPSPKLDGPVARLGYKPVPRPLMDLHRAVIGVFTVRLGPYAMELVGLVALVGAAVAAFYAACWLRRLMRASRLGKCWNCGYEVGTSNLAAVCPECGRHTGSSHSRLFRASARWKIIGAVLVTILSSLGGVVCLNALSVCRHAPHMLVHWMARVEFWLEGSPGDWFAACFDRDNQFTFRGGPPDALWRVRAIATAIAEQVLDSRIDDRWRPFAYRAMFAGSLDSELTCRLLENGVCAVELQKPESVVLDPRSYGLSSEFLLMFWPLADRLGISMATEYGVTCDGESIRFIGSRLRLPGASIPLRGRSGDSFDYAYRMIYSNDLIALFGPRWPEVLSSLDRRDVSFELLVGVCTGEWGETQYLGVLSVPFSDLTLARAKLTAWPFMIMSMPVSARFRPSSSSELKAERLLSLSAPPQARRVPWLVDEFGRRIW